MRLGPASSKISRDHGSEVFHPAAYRFIGNHDPAFSQQVLDIAEAEGEPGIQPDGLLNDYGWEAIAAKDIVISEAKELRHPKGGAFYPARASPFYLSANAKSASDLVLQSGLTGNVYSFVCFNYLPTKASTLLIPSGTVADPGKKHLFFILTNRCADGFHLAISMSSIKSGRVHDPTCLLKVGDYPFIDRDSFMSYRLSRQLHHEGIKNGVESPLYIAKEDCNLDVLQRIIDGVEVSHRYRSRQDIPSRYLCARFAAGRPAGAHHRHRAGADQIGLQNFVYNVRRLATLERRGAHASFNVVSRLVAA